MKALTLHQPVATLMGLKDVENRGWKPPLKILGQRIAIHAGKTWNREYESWMRNLDLTSWARRLNLDLRDSDIDTIISKAIDNARKIKGVIVSTAILAAWYDKRDNHYEGTAEQIAYIKASPWFGGPVGWLLTDFEIIDKPVACKGSLGLWKVPNQIECVLHDNIFRPRRPWIMESGQ